MESREFETRCRVAAWAIAYWGRILLLMFVYGIVVHHEVPIGLLVILATEFIHRRVRKGERIGSILVLLVLLLFQFVGLLWTTLDRAGPDPTPKVRFLIGFAAANVVLVGIATVATWRAFAAAPRPAQPERTPAQIARHRQLGG